PTASLGPVFPRSRVVLRSPPLTTTARRPPPTRRYLPGDQKKPRLRRAVPAAARFGGELFQWQELGCSPSPAVRLPDLPGLSIGWLLAALKVFPAAAASSGCGWRTQRHRGIASRQPIVRSGRWAIVPRFLQFHRQARVPLFRTFDRQPRAASARTQVPQPNLKIWMKPPRAAAGAGRTRTSELQVVMREPR
ncbi:unnamed protein product, partial [Urochloa humidicola]